MSLLVAALPLANYVTTADEPLADLKKKARTELVAYLKSVHGITSLADRYLLSDALEAYDLDVVPSICWFFAQHAEQVGHVDFVPVRRSDAAALARP